MATVMFSINVAEIFAINKKCDLENEDEEGEKLDVRYSTGNVWFYIGDFFSEF